MCSCFMVMLVILYLCFWIEAVNYICITSLSSVDLGYCSLWWLHHLGALLGYWEAAITIFSNFICLLFSSCNQCACQRFYCLFFTCYSNSGVYSTFSPVLRSFLRHWETVTLFSSICSGTITPANGKQNRVWPAWTMISFWDISFCEERKNC